MPANLVSGVFMQLSEIRYYFPKDDLYSLLKLLAIPVGLATMVFTAWAFGEVKEYLANPTYEKLRQRIEAELLPGTDKKKVLFFLDQNKIGHGDYHPVPSEEKRPSMEFDDEKVKKKLDHIHYRIYSGRDISNWRSITGCWVELWFYFDEEGKLVDYQMHGLCDG